MARDMASRRAYNAKYMSELRADLVRLGLCIDCRADIEPERRGRARCRRCSRALSKIQRARRRSPRRYHCSGCWSTDHNVSTCERARGGAE